MISRTHFITAFLTLAITLWPCQITPLQAGDAIDAHQPYSAIKLKSVIWDGEMVFIVSALYKTKTLRVWVPIPPSDNAQARQSSAFETFPVDVKPQIGTEPVFGNTFA